MKIRITLFLLLVLVVSSCRKDKVPHPYAGTYDCTVSYFSWNLNGGYSSSTEQKNIDVLLIGDTVDVFGYRIHEDSIVMSETYFSGFSYNYMSFHFEPDSIYIKTFSGGLGGGTNTSYKGRKIN